MKVILIRHTSVDVPKGVCYGQTDVPVAATFTEEAEMTKKALGDRTFDAVFSSPLTRARLLADYCGYPTPVTDNRLMEMNMGDWEMKRYDDIKDDNLQKWYDDYMHVATTNGESFPMVYERVAGFLDELKQKPREDSCSTDSLRSSMEHACTTTMAFWAQWHSMLPRSARCA